MRHFFSRARLRDGCRDNAWMRDLLRRGEAYRDHALIWQLFPGDGVARDFLFRRLDESDRFYIVSARPPALDTPLFDVQSKPYDPRLRAGDRIRFDLRANPTVSVGNGQGRSRRHDVLMDAKRRLSLDPSGDLADVLGAAGRRWMLERAVAWGLDVEETLLLQQGYRQHRLSRKGQQIQYSSLDYQGVAHVADPDRLRAALLQGVGHAKGFGCGLLMVRHV